MPLFINGSRNGGHRFTGSLYDAPAGGHALDERLFALRKEMLKNNPKLSQKDLRAEFVKRTGANKTLVRSRVATCAFVNWDFSGKTKPKLRKIVSAEKMARQFILSEHGKKVMDESAVNLFERMPRSINLGRSSFFRIIRSLAGEGKFDGKKAFVHGGSQRVYARRR